MQLAGQLGAEAAVTGVAGGRAVLSLSDSPLELSEESPQCSFTWPSILQWVGLNFFIEISKRAEAEAARPLETYTPALGIKPSRKAPQM